MKDLSDEELIKVYRDEDGIRKHRAFELLYKRYVELLINYLYFSLDRDNDKACDIAHDIFLQILESPEKFNSNLNFKPWLLKVASNRCKNEFRKEKTIRKYEHFSRSFATERMELNEKDEHLRLSFRTLDAEHRSLLTLRFKLKMTVKEIARIYDCPEGTIKSRLFYATKSLTKNYKTIAYGSDL